MPGYAAWRLRRPRCDYTVNSDRSCTPRGFLVPSRADLEALPVRPYGDGDVARTDVRGCARTEALVSGATCVGRGSGFYCGG
ncbi:hypothetical protein GOBAR_DD00564 [Gossypium barbadense]|nr:hypothetical protein GOBAR_DD00564 [Gossypium barbadense]